MTIFFKLKKANASTKLAYFSEKPSWEDLTSKIARLFNIPSDRVGVAFVEKEEPITLSSEDELQGFYKYESSEVLDLVVQDTLDPDTSITSTWSQDTNLSDQFKSDDEFKLFCWVLGGFGGPFPVDIGASKTVGDLKNAIKKVQVHAFAKIDAHTLNLWKLTESELVDPDDTLPERMGLRGNNLMTFATRLSSGNKLSTLFPQNPLEGHLHIVVHHPSVVALFSSENTNLSQDSRPPWLVEIHNKLWGKRDLFGQIFRTANLTTTNFIELQLRLDSNDPSRSSPSYAAQNVLDIKSDFLRKKSSIAIDATESDTTPNRNLVPSVYVSSLVLPPSTLSTPPHAMDIDAAANHEDCDDSAEPSVIRNISVQLAGLANTPSTSKAPPCAPPILDDAMNVDADADSSEPDSADSNPTPQFANCPDYILADAAELSTGSAAVLPCIIRYMDLTALKLRYLSRVPSLTLIRDEWKTMIDVFNGREGGVYGSAVFTGSPGIGKTCLLYYILILCLIRAQPVVFQDMEGDVFLITDTVLPQTGWVTAPGDDVLTLVDADGEFCIPNKYFFHTPNLRILLTSSPRSRAHRRWLVQHVQDEGAAYVVSPWLRDEWLVASLFIAKRDITLQRFGETARICGFVPREFLNAVGSPVARAQVQMKILKAIESCKDITEAIHVAGDLAVPHRAFVVYPGDEYRSLVDCLIKPISEYAMDTIIITLDERSADAAFNLYQSIQGSSLAAAFRGKLWERKVHGYFRRTAASFTIRSLESTSTRPWDFSKDVKHFDFGPPQMLAGEIARCVAAGESVYLQPMSDNFTFLDSIIYQPTDRLVGMQITDALIHPIKATGLSALQVLLKPKHALLAPLRPTVEKPWILLFVVPTPMENSFTRQNIEGVAANWNRKTVQYVLGLDGREVFKISRGE